MKLKKKIIKEELVKCRSGRLAIMGRRERRSKAKEGRKKG